MAHARHSSRGPTGGSAEQPLLASQGSASGGGRSSVSGGSGGLKRILPLLALVVLVALGAMLLTGSAVMRSTAQMSIQMACRQVGNTTSGSRSQQEAAAAPSPPPPPPQPKQPAPPAPAPEQQQATAAFAAIPVLTQLHNKLLRKSHDNEAHRKSVLATLDELVHLSDQAAEAAIKQRLQESKELAQLFTLRLYGLLLGTGKLIPCREDTTLGVNDPLPLTGSADGNSSSSPPRYFFATNLRDNAENMPQFTLSLLQTLLRLPLGTAFVSAYESNSDDGAHGWIDVLQLALNIIGTPSDLVTRGMLVRLDGTPRIEHLARTRNMALTPLQQHYAVTRGQQQHEGSSSAGTSSRARHVMSGAQGSTPGSRYSAC